MATPAEKLGSSLRLLKQLQDEGRVAIRSSDLTRTHRERLVKNGFLKEVMKGWLIASRPEEKLGESTAWFTSFWGFCSQYFTERFGGEWSLSPEQSLILHAGNDSVPNQVMLRAAGARNKKTDFPHRTSVYESKASYAKDEALIEQNGLRLYRIENALVAVQASFFEHWPTEARTVLAIIPDASGLLAILLEGGHTRAAGRLAGAFRSIGQGKIADEILGAMKAASHTVNEVNPFQTNLVIGDAGRITSPHIHRLRLKWEKMREDVLEILPAPKPIANDADTYLTAMDEIFVTDAYHSLSIEGYQVSTELIEKVQAGNWDPTGDDKDKATRDALAARGYYEAFQRVKTSVTDVLNGQDAGAVIEADLSDWYRALFTPSVTAGIIGAAQLAGYRNAPVFIRDSQHVPMSVEAVRECMPVFFELMKQEEDARVRVVLGHFIFVFIHPYLDGNGRTARFMMNVALAAAGYPWTVIRVEDRRVYMQALEEASVREDVVPFAKFLAENIEKTEKGGR